MIENRRERIQELGDGDEHSHRNVLRRFCVLNETLLITVKIHILKSNFTDNIKHRI